VIGCVGRLQAVKGHRVLIEALPELCREVPDLVCVIVGDGPERAGLQRLAERLRVAERVVWTGSRRDIENFVPFFRVFVMPSISEAFGIAAAEALYAGVPVVASRIGGLPEVVDHGKDGYLVPSQDPGALARSVALILKDQELAATMRANALAKRQRFAAKVLAEQWASVYDELVNTRGGNGRSGAVINH
jgi:glycosyltransferase involved in cell wall biosynthesis